jgi:hypothetical protein
MIFDKIETPNHIKSRDQGKWDLDVWCWQDICGHVMPDKILELGTGRGLFLSSVMPSLPDSTAVTVNAPLGKKTGGKFTTFEVPGNEIGEMFRGKEYCDRIDQIFCLTKDMMIPLSGKRFNIVHIDASHDKDDIVNDTENSIKLLLDHGLIVWHDFHPNNPEPWNKEVFGAIEHLQSRGTVGKVYWFERSWVAYWVKTTSS